MFRNITISIIFCLLFYNSAKAQLITNKLLLHKTDSMFEVQKKLAENRNKELFSVFKNKLNKLENEAMRFLFAFMPLSDLAEYSGNFFLTNVKYSLRSKTDFSWGKTIPEDVFLHFVLPVRVNNENLDSFRIKIYDELSARVKGKSMKNAVLEINHWCHEKVTYRGTDSRTSSPLATLKTSFGRCGEESTFAVAAFRTVGIPARQVYTPRWAHSDDNHAWVEVWVDGKWHFLGACEPEPDLDMGWFAEPARRAMLVHTRAYGWYNGTEPVILREDRFSELNLIENYAPAKKITVKVIDEKMQAVKDAKVDFLLYNYSEFFPIATQSTDKNGFASLLCGLGDLIVWVSQNGNAAHQKISVSETDTLILSLKKFYNFLSKEYDWIPPVPRSIQLASDKGRAENDRLLKHEDSLRTSYMKTFKDSVWADKLAAKLNLNSDSVGKIIINSYGNWKEIQLFLENAAPEKRKAALKMLFLISEKDLRDVETSVLADHLNYCSVDNFLLNMNVFFANVLNPRISYEMLSPWRSFLQKNLKSIFQKNEKPDADIIIKWIAENIKIDLKANLHSRTPLTPIAVFNLKVSDIRSRNIFFVAVCRSFDIPARLNPETLVPEYFSALKWRPVIFETTTQSEAVKGFVNFINKSNDIKPKYYINFTIAKFQNGIFKTLEFEENRLVDDFPDKIEVDTGQYMIVTGNRLPDGSVLCNTDFFTVSENNVKSVEVKVREQKHLAEPWGTLDHLKYNFNDSESGVVYNLNECAFETGAILIYIDPDKEPTKHVMKDIPEFTSVFEKWGGLIFFVVNKSGLSNAFNKGQYKNLPVNSKFVSESVGTFLSVIEKIRNKNLKDSYPIIVVCDKNGKLVYFSEGYKIGVGEQLAKIILRMNQNKN